MPVSGEMSVKSNEAEQRPPSDNLVDLHVSVVPMKHWVEKLNSASHKVIGDTFSAGFIRVLPETSIANLRRDIKLQLGSEIFPKDYVFLKHVGRCLALVRQTQERQLKVKNFLPPHSMLPEVFILPGQPTMYSYSVLPPIQPRLQDLHKSVSDLDSTQTILKSDENVKQLPPMQMSYKLNDEVDSLSPSYNNSPMLKTKAQTSLKRVAYSPKPNNHSPVNTKPNQGGRSPLKSRIPSSVRKRDIKRQQRHVSGKSSIDNEVDHSKSTSAFVLEERGRTTPGQIAIDSQSNVHHQNNEKQNGFINKSQPFPNESGPSQAKSVLREGPKKRRVRYNMPPQSNASSRGFLTPATGDKWMPATLATARRENQVKSSSANDDSGFVEHESDSGESYKAQNKRKPYDDTAYGDAENVQETPVNSNSTVAPTHEHSAASRNDKNSRISPTPSPIMVPESGETDARRNETLLSDAPLSDVNDSVAQEQPETRKSPAFATASSPKRLGSSERAKLWKELQHVRSERRRVEKDRQDLVKHAKIVTSKTNQRRNTVITRLQKLFWTLGCSHKKGECSEICGMPGCCYVFDTFSDKQRHFDLVHKGKTAAGGKDETKLWSQSILSPGRKMGVLDRDKIAHSRKTSCKGLEYFETVNERTFSFPKPQLDAKESTLSIHISSRSCVSPYDTDCRCWKNIKSPSLSRSMLFLNSEQARSNCSEFNVRYSK